MPLLPESLTKSNIRYTNKELEQIKEDFCNSIAIMNEFKLLIEKIKKLTEEIKNETKP